MLNINGKQWHDLTSEDVVEFLRNAETDENFFFEFKDDDIQPNKITKEVSAFANTYGGYIFFGVTNSKAIAGCTKWDEQRIHVILHDSLTPTPSFDIKKFLICDKIVYILRVDEGAEPPYITNDGKIYERLSSGSFPIKDSAKLMHLHNKHEKRIERLLRKIEIPAVDVLGDNVYGYIDMGFSVTTKDSNFAIDCFRKADFKEIMRVLREEKTLSAESHLSLIGESVYCSPGGLSSKAGLLPAHLNNFIEIMCDGSARMRVILSNNDPKDSSVYMMQLYDIISSFERLYECLFGGIFPDSFVFAKKYEALTVFKQFHPVFLYDPSVVTSNPSFAEENQRISQKIYENIEALGNGSVITNDRIPKTGLYTVDRQLLQRCGISDFEAKSFLRFLFLSKFVGIGLPHERTY